MAQTVKNLQCRRHGFDPYVRKISWRREQLLTPVFWPGEFHGQRSLVGYSSQGCKESDMTERLSLHFVNLYAEHIMLNAGLDESESESCSVVSDFL